jgi:hypothetical protein
MFATRRMLTTYDHMINPDAPVSSKPLSAWMNKSRPKRTWVNLGIKSLQGEKNYIGGRAKQQICLQLSEHDFSFAVGNIGQSEIGQVGFFYTQVASK